MVSLAEGEKTMNLTDFAKPEVKPKKRFDNGLWIETDEEKDNWKRI
jgi:hypothetical protein